MQGPHPITAVLGSQVLQSQDIRLMRGLGKSSLALYHLQNSVPGWAPHEGFRSEGFRARSGMIRKNRLCRWPLLLLLLLLITSLARAAKAPKHWNKLRIAPHHEKKWKGPSKSAHTKPATHKKWTTTRGRARAAGPLDKATPLSLWKSEVESLVRSEDDEYRNKQYHNGANASLGESQRVIDRVSLPKLCPEVCTQRPRRIALHVCTSYY